jgi:hypothetical protein
MIAASAGCGPATGREYVPEKKNKPRAHPRVPRMDEAADLAWSDGTYGTVSDVRIRAVASDIGRVLKQVGRISDFEGTWQERLGMTQAEFGQALASARYNLVRDLGRGGMGAVYLVRHVDTGRAADRCRTLARVRSTSGVPFILDTS